MKGRFDRLTLEMLLALLSMPAISFSQGARVIELEHADKVEGRQVDGEDVGHCLLEIVKDSSAHLHREYDGRKVIVK